MEVEVGITVNVWVMDGVVVCSAVTVKVGVPVGVRVIVGV